jgi:hypothetical protein
MSEDRLPRSRRDEPNPVAGDAATSESAHVFPPTDWGLVLSAGGDSRAALERLCRRYSGPAYAFVRSAGYDRDAALELMDQFFVELGERNALSLAKDGSQPFRLWLTTALRTFLAERSHGERRTTPAQNRVQAHAAVADAMDRESGRALEPQREYERVLAVSVLERALVRLANDQADRGQRQRFLALEPWLVAEPSEDEFSSLEKELGLGPTSARMVRHALRQRLSYFIRQELSNLLERRDDTEALRTEMAALLGALGS